SHARAHRLSPDHRSQREVLADVAQERNDLEPGQPFVIVDDDGRPEAVEAEERADLALQALGPGGDLIHRMQSPFPPPAARIADQTGTAADEHDRTMTGDLRAAQVQKGQQAPDVQAVGGGIESHIHGARRRGVGEMTIELLAVGDVGDESARLEVPQEWRLHASPGRLALSHSSVPSPKRAAPARTVPYNLDAWRRRRLAGAAARVAGDGGGGGVSHSSASRFSRFSSGPRSA